MAIELWTGLGPRSLLPTFPCVSRPPSLLSQDAFGRQGRHGNELWTGLGPRSFLPRSMYWYRLRFNLALFLFFLSLSASPIPRRGARVSKTFIVAWASACVLATPCLPLTSQNHLPSILKSGGSRAVDWAGPAVLPP